MRKPKLVPLITTCLVFLVVLPACMTCRKASMATPYVINFQFFAPLSARSVGLHEGEMVNALNRFAVRKSSFIRTGKEVFWPIRAERMRMGLVTRADDTGTAHGRAHNPPQTSNLSAASDDGAQKPTAARPPHTEYVSFANAECLRCFVKALAGEACQAEGCNPTE